MAFVLHTVFLFCALSGLVSVSWSRSIVKVKGPCCPRGWTQLDCRCFIFQDEGRSFSDAESVCNILGGNLASVHNNVEYAVVLGVIAKGTSSDYWIGLHEALGSDDFIWTDGTPVDFTAFNSNNDSGDCIEVEVDDDLWDNQPCDSPNRYICAKDADECFH
ncbi:galactose-specific lectin nattectin-like isoform X2 [Syngnathus scovelli]|uniref:galactose-specific lectin nattectin-like isoform X2 n=1 Tax=Syngnathus scovelli TaxID=161590 RepID=UPI00210F3D81|nr:galactose-specific lectin nattectin-like isoform X2 [Syngnathus scovelli]